MSRWQTLNVVFPPTRQFILFSDLANTVKVHLPDFRSTREYLAPPPADKTAQARWLQTWIHEKYDSTTFSSRLSLFKQDPTIGRSLSPSLSHHFIKWFVWLWNIFLKRIRLFITKVIQKEIIYRHTMSSFKPGDMVHVESRTSPGENKPGGVAHVTELLPNSKLGVNYVLGGRETVDAKYVTHFTYLERTNRRRAVPSSLPLG